MPSITIRPFQASEWPQYRDLRLRALGDSPDAFGGTLAQAQGHLDEHWASRLSAASPETDLPLLVEIDGLAGGMAWGRIEPPEPGQAHIYQMWVAPVYRGLGIGGMLLDALTTWARARQVRTVLLGVTCGKSPARQLYVSAGFRPVGEPEPLRPGSRLLAQPMALELSPHVA